MREKKSGRIIGAAMLLLLLATPAMAQLQVGDNTVMTMNGNLGYGYSGSFANTALLPSSHSQGFQGDANLDGHYFHPNFISFNFRPYFQRMQANSESQILTSSTGFGGGLSFFGGSMFPGSINFSKDFSANSEFSIAGVPGLEGDSSGRTFGVTWGVLVPNYPQLRLYYDSGKNSGSVTGVEGKSETSSRNYGLSSGYKLKGWSLQGGIDRHNNHFVTPGYLTAEPFENGGSSTTYTASGQHNLPLNGSFGTGWAHSSYEGEDGHTWDSTAYNGSATINPRYWLSLGQTVSYTTNLSASGQPLFGTGGSAQTVLFSTDTSSLYLGSTASVRVFRRLALNGHFNHRRQWFAGHEFENSQYGGSVTYNYTSPLFGFLYFGLGVIDTLSKEGNQGLGLVANLGMNRKIGEWESSADFNYQQNVQTLINVQASSNYSFGGSIRRRFNQDTFFATSFRGSRSGLVIQEGNGNRAESFGTSFAWRRYAVGASYSQSSGTAVLTSGGALTAAPDGALIANDFLYFDARSYSVNFSTRFRRNLLLAVGYVSIDNGTARGQTGVRNIGERYSARFEYRLRKFAFIGGFNRSYQDIGTVAGPGRVVNSYRLSITRWFNIF
ncbi:MAG TPA: hypothetical protein VN577_12675 [Terriglobales bacterium]|nr:hypothetical protein [Terriglobales bacterium]